MRKYFIGFILIFLPFVIFAQGMVGVSIHTPPPERLAVEDLWWVTLNNRTGEPLTVYLHGTATVISEAPFGTGVVFEAKTNEFELPPGTKIIRYSDIRKLRDVEYNEECRSYIQRTRKLPDGLYKVCIEVVNASSGEVLGQSCIEHMVRTPRRPILIRPGDGVRIGTKTPIFSWRLEGTTIPMVGDTFLFRLVKIYDAQTPYEAMEANPPWFETKVVETSLRYPVSAKELELGKYAWRVELFSGVAKIAESDVRTFEVTEPVMAIQPAGVELTIDTISALAGLAGLLTVEKKLGIYFVSKSVDKKSAEKGDTLEYTIRITAGKKIKSGLKVIDPIPAGTELVKKSVKVTDAKTGKKIRAGVRVVNGKLEVKLRKSIKPKTTVQVKFKVVVKNVPADGVIRNTGIAILPRGEGKLVFDKVVETAVKLNLEVTKKADKEKVGPGEYVTYTITIKNNEERNVEIDVFELIPDETELVDSVEVDGKKVDAELVTNSDFDTYAKVKVKIKAGGTVKIKVKVRVIDYGTIENRVRIGTADGDDVATCKVVSDKETYRKHTYTRELADLREHKKLANKIHTIDDVLEVIDKGGGKYQFKCGNWTVVINVRVQFGSTPAVCGPRDSISGEAESEYEWNVDLQKKLITFDVAYRIVYDKIYEYNVGWRENKALLFHEFQHVQLQIDNWKDPAWQRDFCKKLKKLFRKGFPYSGKPPKIIQSQEEDHKKIGKNSTEGWHKMFLDELKKIKR